MARGRGGLVQLVKHWTGMLLTQVRFPNAARDFFPVNFQCKLFYSVCKSPCAITCIHNSVHVKGPVVHVWTPSMHRWLGSVTLSQPTFPGESNPNMPWKKFQWDNTVVKWKCNNNNNKKVTPTRHQSTTAPACNGNNKIISNHTSPLPPPPTCRTSHEVTN